MAKWVTILLLVLALVAYGFSHMRPVPESQESVSTPEISVAEQTPDDTTETSVDSSETPEVPQGRTAKAPTFRNFDPSPTPTASANPAASPEPAAAIAITTPKTKAADPFASKRDKPKPKPVAGTIKAVVMSSSAGGHLQTRFPLETESIYLTATPEGLKDSVDVVASYRTVLDEKAEFSTPVESSGPPRKRVFRIVPPAQGWTSGPYQVVLKVKGSDQILGLERFEILGEKETVKKDYPAPEYLDLVPDLQSEHQTTFDKTSTSVLLRVSAQELPRGTEIRSVWSAVKVDRLTEGELIATSTQSAPGPGQDAVFTFEAPPGGFHIGSYKVDVYFDQSPAGSQSFFIQAPVPASDS